MKDNSYENNNNLNIYMPVFTYKEISIISPSNWTEEQKLYRYNILGGNVRNYLSCFSSNTFSYSLYIAKLLRGLSPNNFKFNLIDNNINKNTIEKIEIKTKLILIDNITNKINNNNLIELNNNINNNIIYINKNNDIIINSNINNNFYINNNNNNQYEYTNQYHFFNICEKLTNILCTFNLSDQSRIKKYYINTINIINEYEFIWSSPNI